MIYRRGGREGVERGGGGERRIDQLQERREEEGERSGGDGRSRTDPQRDEGVRASVNPARSIVAN